MSGIAPGSIFGGPRCRSTADPLGLDPLSPTNNIGGVTLEDFERAIAEHRRAIEAAGHVYAATPESRRRMEVKHEADSKLWRLINPLHDFERMHMGVDVAAGEDATVMFRRVPDNPRESQVLVDGVPLGVWETEQPSVGATPSGPSSAWVDVHSVKALPCKVVTDHRMPSGIFSLSGEPIPEDVLPYLRGARFTSSRFTMDSEGNCAPLPQVQTGVIQDARYEPIDPVLCNHATRKLPLSHDAWMRQFEWCPHCEHYVHRVVGDYWQAVNLYAQLMVRECTEHGMLPTSTGGCPVCEHEQARPRINIRFVIEVPKRLSEATARIERRMRELLCGYVHNPRTQATWEGCSD